MTKWLRHILGSWREWINPIPLAALALSLIFGWYIVFGDQGLVRLRQLRHTEGELRQRELALSSRLQTLAQEKVRLDDPDYLELIIRRELGYVRSGELIYQFPEPEVRVGTPPATITTPRTAGK
ncbi:MAG: septum formation initiator family protein [Deltaproteobacteria bacterium]|nr:septum formation initiator family protein [Deltaproteobacteria bacterium]